MDTHLEDDDSDVNEGRVRLVKVDEMIGGLTVWLMMTVSLKVSLSTGSSLLWT